VILTQYYSGNQIKKNELRWAGENLEDLDVDEMIILKCIFKKWNEEAWSGLLWLRTRAGDGGL
jgi:hypothetical protein